MAAGKGFQSFMFVNYKIKLVNVVWSLPVSAFNSEIRWWAWKSIFSFEIVFPLFLYVHALKSSFHITVFWNVMLCSLISTYWCFIQTYLPEYVATFSRRLWSEYSSPWDPHILYKFLWFFMPDFLFGFPYKPFIIVRLCS